MLLLTQVKQHPKEHVQCQSVYTEQQVHTLNSPFSLGEAQVIGPGEGASVSLTGGVGGSLSRICSGTRSWRVMRGGGT